MKFTQQRAALEWERKELDKGSQFSQRSIYGVYYKKNGNTDA